MNLERQLKIALDENRLLILGTQVLFGFQFNSVFQELFQRLPEYSRALACSGLVLIPLTLGLLIAPSMQHRIVEGGQVTARVLVLAGVFAGWALLPLAVALACDSYLVMEHIAGPPWDVVTGAGFFAIAMLCWFALAFFIRRKRQPMPSERSQRPTPIEVQIDQLLTEARLIIPGAQALMGFQLTVTLTRAFEELPPESKVAHAAALCCVGLAVILLMAPASLHRIAFGGEDDPDFLEIGSVFVVAAPIPLAFGIALDTYVAAGRALESASAAAALATTAILVLMGLWYAYPIWRRMMQGSVRP